MNVRDIFVTAVSATLLTPLVLIGVSLVSAQAMQSGNYKIESDSINFGGGLSTSTNYALESTSGEVATGDSDSTNYGLRAGYQQMLTTFISMSAAAPVTMSPSIPGVSGGTANGSTAVTVTTDSFAGYELTIEAESAPALVKGGDSIADYVPVGVPDFTFTTDAPDAHFGYSPEGDDVVNRFKDDGAACGVGILETALACWDGLDTVSEPIARSTGANTPSGTETTIHFRVGIGGSVVQAEGVYTATTTLTAISL